MSEETGKGERPVSREIKKDPKESRPCFTNDDMTRLVVCSDSIQEALMRLNDHAESWKNAAVSDALEEAAKIASPTQCWGGEEINGSSKIADAILALKEKFR